MYVIESIANAETWREFLDKFSSYEGSVISLCKENNISKGRFYHYKKRFEKKSNKPTFHAISLFRFYFKLRLKLFELSLI